GPVEGDRAGELLRVPRLEFSPIAVVVVRAEDTGRLLGDRQPCLPDDPDAVMPGQPGLDEREQVRHPRRPAGLGPGDLVGTDAQQAGDLVPGPLVLAEAEQLTDLALQRLDFVFAGALASQRGGPPVPTLRPGGDGGESALRARQPLPHVTAQAALR